MNLSQAIFSGVLRVPEGSGSFHQGEEWKMGQFGICLHPYTLLSIYEFILSSVDEKSVSIDTSFDSQLISCLAQRIPFTLTSCSFGFWTLPWELSYLNVPRTPCCFHGPVLEALFLQVLFFLVKHLVFRSQGSESVCARKTTGVVTNPITEEDQF